MQDNNRIIEDLSEWVEPIEGWFWDNFKDRAIKSVLVGFDVEKELSFRTSNCDGYDNFSLADPNKKKLISTVGDAVAWAEANTHAVLVKIRDGGIALDAIRYCDYPESFRNSWESLKVMVGVDDDLKPMVKPLTEIEAV